jgi:hypothetical protein
MIGTAIEYSQTWGELYSAFSFKDLPSNRFGREFADHFNRPSEDWLVCRIDFEVAQFLATRLGGVAAGPVEQLSTSSDNPRSFNFVRNFSDRPILRPDASDLITDGVTGIRYRSSGNASQDQRWLNRLSGAGLDGSHTGVGGAAAGPGTGSGGSSP